MDLRRGPAGNGAFQPNEMVACDYVEATMRGSSRKFHCAVDANDIVKVRYGAHNGHVEGSLLATRLLWALGFAADRVYAVRVTCRGCSSDPWYQHGRSTELHEFDPAVIERQPHGVEMTLDNRKAGWGWSELDLIDERQGGAPSEQRDALKLLAVLIQHTDTKPQQQRLLCLPGGLTAGGCERPFMMLHDVGLTFGHANTFNRSRTGSVNLEEWAKTPIWKDRATCVGHLSQSHTGTLGDPRVSEAGRRFLAELLLQVSDAQLRDLFDAARVEPQTGWVEAFKRKRDEIVTNRCPS